KHPAHPVLNLPPPHRARHRDPHLHRLPRVEGRRQQRLDRVPPHAGHRAHELRRPVCLGRRGRLRPRGRGRHRARRAAGRHRQPPPRDGLSRALPRPRDARRAVRPENQEQKVHPIYDYAFVTDREEGLVVVGPLHTLLDGDPRNNFVHRAATFNEGGALAGASSMTLAGTVGYVTTPQGIVVLDLDDPLVPKVLARIGAPAVKEPRGLAVQFRYAFVVDAEGLKVLDVTAPREPRAVDGAAVPIPDARSVYLARTYAYVAAGRPGIAIVDVEPAADAAPRGDLPAPAR